MKILREIEKVPIEKHATLWREKVPSIVLWETVGKRPGTYNPSCGGSADRARFSQELRDIESVGESGWSVSAVGLMARRRYFVKQENLLSREHPPWRAHSQPVVDDQGRPRRREIDFLGYISLCATEIEGIPSTMPSSVERNVYLMSSVIIIERVRIIHPIYVSLICFIFLLLIIINSLYTIYYCYICSGCTTKIVCCIRDNWFSCTLFLITAMISPISYSAMVHLYTGY